MISHPTAPRILQAVVEWLEHSQSGRTGQDAYLALVARNALGTVLREMQQSPAADAASLMRLQTLLGSHGTLPDLEIALVARLRAGTIACDDPALLAHLRAQNADNLRIDQPRYKAGP